MILRAVDGIHVDTFHTAQTQCRVKVGGGTRGSTSGVACWEVPAVPGLPKLSPVGPWQQGQLLDPHSELRSGCRAQHPLMPCSGDTIQSN